MQKITFINFILIVAVVDVGMGGRHVAIDKRHKLLTERNKKRMYIINKDYHCSFVDCFCNLNIFSEAYKYLFVFVYTYSFITQQNISGK